MSLLRSSAATKAEAERHGPAWEFYELSLASSEAQAHQARSMEQKVIDGERQRLSAAH